MAYEDAVPPGYAQRYRAPNAPDPLELAAMRDYALRQQATATPVGPPSGSYQYPGQPKIDIPLDARGQVRQGFHVPSMDSQGRNDPNVAAQQQRQQAQQPTPQKIAPPPPEQRGASPNMVGLRAGAQQAPPQQRGVFQGVEPPASTGAPPDQQSAPQGQERTNVFAEPPAPPKITGIDEVMASVRRNFPRARPEMQAEIAFREYAKAIQPENQARTLTYETVRKEFSDNMRFRQAVENRDIKTQAAFVRNTFRTFDTASKALSKIDKQIEEQEAQALMLGNAAKPGWFSKPTEEQIRAFAQASDVVAKLKKQKESVVHLIDLSTQKLQAVAPELMQIKPGSLAEAGDEESGGEEVGAAPAVKAEPVTQPKTESEWISAYMKRHGVDQNTAMQVLRGAR